MTYELTPPICPATGARVDTRPQMTEAEFLALAGGEARPTRFVREARLVMHEADGPRPVEVTLTCEPGEFDAVMAGMTAALQALDWHCSMEVCDREVPA